MESNVIDVWNDIMYHNIKQHYSPSTLEITSTCLPWVPLVLSDQLAHPSSVLTFNSSLTYSEQLLIGKFHILCWCWLEIDLFIIVLLSCGFLYLNEFLISWLFMPPWKRIKYVYMENKSMSKPFQKKKQYLIFCNNLWDAPCLKLYLGFANIWKNGILKWWMHWNFLNLLNDGFYSLFLSDLRFWYTDQNIGILYL